jgi:hypothetical protein
MCFYAHGGEIWLTLYLYRMFHNGEQIQVSI